MPNSNIGALTALKRAEKEAKRAQTEAARISLIAALSQTSPLDLSEPHVNTDFLDIPCTPIATTTEPSKPQVAPIEVVARAFS